MQLQEAARRARTHAALRAPHPQRPAFNSQGEGGPSCCTCALPTSLSACRGRPATHQQPRRQRLGAWQRSAPKARLVAAAAAASPPLFPRATGTTLPPAFLHRQQRQQQSGATTTLWALQRPHSQRHPIWAEPVWQSGPKQFAAGPMARLCVIAELPALPLRGGGGGGACSTPLPHCARWPRPCAGAGGRLVAGTQAVGLLG